ncbi:MAG: aldehyde dehydrogenase family protein [Herpetosiphonaceae bacterium]|nr:aldehyde dehydrogenase family protein [Herpetosiphonaceae bacterium]
MGKIIAPVVAWDGLIAQAKSVVPEAFGTDGHVLNLIEGQWGHPGHHKPAISPVDGTVLGALPMIDLETARHAVRFAKHEFDTWSHMELDERCAKVRDCLAQLRQQRELIGRLLMWEIGKPHKQAMTDVDRCITGVEWYVDHIESMVAGRQALGVISNIASWNYPLSVLVHAVLVQALVGNAVIAKTPTDGGLYALTVALGLARRCGLPVSLVSGSGGQLGDALVRSPDVDCLAFVGGRANGRDVAASLYDRDKRYMLEMEGVNAYGIWEFSDWPTLAAQLKRGFDYGKQRCTAYVRFAVQRQLFPKFLQMYLPMLEALRWGNPMLVDSADDALPTLDFGPLITGSQVESLTAMCSAATAAGAVSLFEGTLDESLFLPDQDVSAYCAPAALLNVPRNCELYHKEPFGPIDTIVVVDRLEELIAEMNVSNGSLVASVACDDARLGQMIAQDVRAFKVGLNTVRSRGDNEEVFGGMGQSWKGCFVGGQYLVQAVTQGPPDEHLYGNFPDYRLLPDAR